MMRTANYRDDVLWPIAYKLGLDPAQEFLTDEGSSLDSYINAWVRRTWDIQDFPEWTTIKEFAPDANHQVPWDAVPVSATDEQPVTLSRPLKVYLVDPRFTPYPIDTRFREWDEGLHVGFDHGATVWIKYMGLAPKFTSAQWNSGTTYSQGALTYSPAAGQCFKSLINGNVGNDPNPAAVTAPIPLVAEVLVPYTPGSPATAGVSEKWSVRVDLLGLYAEANRTYSLTLLDAAGGAHTFSYTTPTAGGTVDNVLTGLIAAAAAVGSAWLAALTLSKDLANSALIIVLASASFSVALATVTTPDEPVTATDPGHVGESVTGDDTLVVTVGPPVLIHDLIKTRVQAYRAAQPALPPTAQVTQLYLSPGPALLPGSAWTITVIDSHGAAHTATYQALSSDGATEIIDGIMAAFDADPYFDAVVITPDYNLRLLTIASPEYVVVQATVRLPTGLNKWELVAFPYALIEPVTRGAYSDALREAGQTDKGMAEEQGAVAEVGDRIGKASATGYDALTDQQRPAPRYRTRAKAAAGGAQ